MDLYSDARQFPRTLWGQATVVFAQDLDRHGLSRSAVKWRTEHGRVWRASYGVYLLGRRPPDLLDYARAALMVAPPGAMIGYHTAAALEGFGVIEDPQIHLVLPEGMRGPERKAIRVHSAEPPIAQVERRHLPCTSPARTAVDLAQTLDRPHALAVLDAALFARACRREDLRAEATRAGLPWLCDLVAIADPRPQCAQETTMRLALHDAGYTGFVPQLPVTDGNATFHPDLVDRRLGVGAEYDGVSHTGRSLRDERDRHNRLQRHLELCYFTARDIYDRPWYLPQTIAEAAQRAHQRGLGS